MYRLLPPLLAVSVVIAAFLGVRLTSTSGSADDSPVFQLPWPVGESWRLTNWPHPSFGWNSPAEGAIDFQPPGYIACSPFVAEDRSVRPVAGGTVIYVNDYIIEIAHSGGYTSFYYHVANARVAPGDPVGIETSLGNPSCYDRPDATVATTGVHVHFAMKRDGRFISLLGLKFGGWLVTPSGLLKDGTLLTDSGIPFVSNEPQPGVAPPPVLPTPTPGADPWAAIEAGWSYRKLPGLEASEWTSALPCVEALYQWNDSAWERGLPALPHVSQLAETRTGPFYWVLASETCQIGGGTTAAGADASLPGRDDYQGPEGPPAGP
jgi:hypothetical protein